MAIIAGTEPNPLAPAVVSPDDMRAGHVPSTDKLTGVVPSSEPAGVQTATESAEDKLKRLRKYLRDYVDLKTEEIDERREALKYYHCKQWTEDELKKLADRGQPEITYNRISRKINGVIGVMERLRQDPKAYARTPAHLEGADLATQSLRYSLDTARWESTLSEVILDMSVTGIGGYQLILEPAEDNSHDPINQRIDPMTFFYDPRSLRPDFSDARYYGVAKWMAQDEIAAFLPGKEAQISESVTTLSSGWLGDADSLDPDRDPLWWDGELKKARVVEVWYRDGAQWKYCIHTGATILDEGDSPWFDGKGKSHSGFNMQSCNVDEKGVRYGFVRNLKGAQDELNHRHSKGVHAYNTKQIVVTDGLVVDVDVIRAEANRPDGVISLPNGHSGKLEVNSNDAQAMANIQMMEVASSEINSFGPDPSLLGQTDNKSGRAIALIQQAAIAELGMFIIRVRALKLNAYTLTWEAIRRYWTVPRYVRITDDEGVANFIGVNQPRYNEWGQQIGTINPIGKVTVDFVLDEGPDTITLREDAQQALSQALQSAAGVVKPAVLEEMIRALIGTMSLPPHDQKRILSKFEEQQPPDPLAMAGAEAELAATQAGAEEKAASARLKGAQAAEKEIEVAVGTRAAQALLAPPQPPQQIPLF